MTLQRSQPRHSVRPSLLLDFANGKTLDPRIDFTRASTASFYDGETYAKAEENLLLYSQEFDESYWVKENVTITADAEVAPDGTTTAETITVVDGSGSSAFFKRNDVPITVGQNIVLSIFAKAGTNDIIRIGHQSSSAGATWFNLTSGTVLTERSGVTGSIVSVGNSWYRCSISLTSTSNSNSAYFVGSCDTDASTSPSATGTTVHLWGAQLEQRDSLTAYTPTTDQPITNYIPALQTAQNNQARFDHDPVTEESLGLLIEEQRVNLLTYSEDFSDSYWLGRNRITSNIAVAPDGTLTADKHVAGDGETLGTGNSQTRFGDSGILKTAGTTYTASIYAKEGGFDSFAIGVIDPGGNQRVDYNLSAVTATRNQGSNIVGSIYPVGNGWYRLVATWTQQQTTDPSNNNRFTTLDSTVTTGDGFSGTFVWGAQLEEGSFPTSYIPTSGSTATRNKDSAEMTGTNFSSWYRQDEGSLYSEFSVYKSIGPFSTIWQLGEGSVNRIWQANIASGVIALRSEFNNDFQVNMGSVVQSDNSYLKTASAYANNDYALIIGETANYDTSVTVPYVDILQIGIAGSDAINGHIRKLAYYPQRLTNEELQRLTEA